MGIKYNGSDVQAIYYNGFTIAKMMNNGNSVWSKPSSNLVYSGFNGLVQTSFVSTNVQFYSHPEGYTIKTYGMNFNTTSKAFIADGSYSTKSIAILTPGLAGKDYNLSADVLVVLRTSSSKAGLLAQGIGGPLDATWVFGEKAVGTYVTGSGSTVNGVLLAQVRNDGNMTNLAHVNVGAPFVSASISLAKRVIFYLERRGDTLYTKIVDSASPSTVYLENLATGIVFNNLGEIVTIFSGAGTSSAIYNFTLEIL